jgi:ABC-2 type transport system permease protein
MSGGSTFSVANAVAWRVLHNVVRNPALLVPSILFPLFFFTAFAGGLSRVAEVPGFSDHFSGNYTAFQFVFVLLQSAAFGGVFTGFGIARDFEGGFARRLMLAAPHRRGLLLGFAVAALGRWLITASLLTVIALIAGMQVGGNGVDLFGLFALAVLVNAAGVLWASGIALRVRSMQAGPLMQMPVFLVLFFAPVYVPLGLLSGWIEAVATVNPFTRLLEAGRGFIAGDPTEVALAFGAALGLVTLFLLWAVRGLRKAEAAG